MDKACGLLLSSLQSDKEIANEGSDIKLSSIKHLVAYNIYMASQEMVQPLKIDDKKKKHYHKIKQSIPQNNGDNDEVKFDSTECKSQLKVS